MNNSNKRVIIYCRESRDDYGENYERIETQRDLCLKYCADKGYTNIVDIIMHDDMTGTDFSRFKELEDKIKNREFDVLVMKDSSRFGRNQVGSLLLLELLQEHGIELEFVTKKFDEDFFGLEAWFNERRAKDDSVKIRANLRRKMEKGELLVRGYYGYNKVDKKLVIDEEAAKVVRKIFDLYIQGYGFRAIAMQLQKEGIPTPSQYKQHGKYPIAKSWKVLHVRRILKNRIYIGDMVSHTTEKVSFKSKKVKRLPQEEWIIVENHHEPIIDRETFEKVQQLIDSKKTYAWKSPEPSPFSGLLICGRCKSPMYIIRSKRIPHAFVCGNYYNEGAIKPDLGIGCTSHRVHEKELFDIVQKHIDKLLEDESYKNELEEIGTSYESSQNYYEELINKTNKELQILQSKYKQVYEDKLNNIIPEFLFIEKTKELNNQINTLNTKLENFKEELNKINKGIEDRSKFNTIITKFKENGLTRETTTEIIDKIIVFDEHEIKEEDKIVFNLTDERFNQIYDNGGIIILYKGMYQHVLTNRWIRKHIGTWRMRSGMGKKIGQTSQ